MSSISLCAIRKNVSWQFSAPDTKIVSRYISSPDTQKNPGDLVYPPALRDFCFQYFSVLRFLQLPRRQSLPALPHTCPE